VRGINYQADPSWRADVLQSRIVDTLTQFGMQGNQHILRQFETLASWSFSGMPRGADFPNEDFANLQDYLACCTTDVVGGSSAKVWGYGEGGRKPDGSRL